MNLILIGNIVALAGAAVMVASGFIKNRKNVLIAQCGQFAIMGVSNLILGGVTGMISNVVSILRNIICLKREFTIPLKIFYPAYTVCPGEHHGAYRLVPNYCRLCLHMVSGYKERFVFEIHNHCHHAAMVCV